MTEGDKITLHFTDMICIFIIQCLHINAVIQKLNMQCPAVSPFIIKSQYYKTSAYYSEIIDYWENVREVRDISNVMEPLFETDINAST